MLKGSGIAGKAQEFGGKVLKPLPVTPNQMTVASVLVAFSGLYFFATGSHWVAIALYALALLVDGLDGAVARAKGMVSAKGAFIDGVADRFVEFAMLAGFAWVGMPAVVLPAVYWIMWMLFFGTCMTSFVKAYAEHSQAMNHGDTLRMRGILERGERVILLAAVAALAAAGFWQGAADLLAFGTVLAAITVLQRIMEVVARS